MGRRDILSEPGVELARRAREGDRLSLARLLTLVENETPQGRLALDWLFRYGGRAHLLGITGSPGTGKSSLVNRIAHYFRHPAAGDPLSVGIVAVDPTSPFSGGAVLGDRVRMRDLAGDPGVFIRSMASRGALGGLARQTAAVVQVMDAVGFDIVMVETVGAGQSEVDIARLAHTTLVVEAPGLGDDIQAIKAGILEIADILVINKADHPGVEATERALRGMLEIGYPHRHRKKRPTSPPSTSPEWTPPVLKTVATTGAGTAELCQAIFGHRAYLEKSAELIRRQFERLQAELELLVQAELVERWRAEVPEEFFEQVLQRLCERSITPGEALHLLIK